MGWQLLDALSDAERRAFLCRCQRRRYPRGAFICHEGDTGDSMYLLDIGTVAIRATSPLGDTVTMTVLRPGDSFGEQALIGDETVRSASVVALERAETLCLSRTDFRSLWEKHPELSSIVVKMLDARLTATTRALLDALYLPSETRVMRRLARLAEIYAGHPSHSIPLTQDDLASMAGTTRQTVNRVLRQAQNDGLIKLTRGHIVVVDAAAVSRRAKLWPD
ncbi:MAG: Crp/Fnr family transcriptional regulator [Acidimicrobiales bacterium]